MNDSSKNQLSKVMIKGFKSIEKCELELTSLNVFIGCNGSGKSNFINFFQMVRQILAKNFQSYVSKQGGPDALLYFGRKRTRQLQAEISFINSGYCFALEPTHDNRMMFTNESYCNDSDSHCIAKGHFESKVPTGIKTPIDPLIVSEIKK
ncbi:MAG: SMC domain protein [Candidatus Magnetoglobus multicellularis str. Araruama]|uniref:SMC domain protein n=1 Tax=Candidatus Magnetoglobus multicellularis str. Araruama TaxID=890399 RepID=A0A1V1NZ95_9BACT|nr:MAG: SMC domain protein [Candidatus Magnetoglobus multicellularis str. Araruama]